VCLHHHHCCCHWHVYVPKRNTPSHDNQKKINSGPFFSFLYGSQISCAKIFLNMIPVYLGCWLSDVGSRSGTINQLLFSIMGLVIGWSFCFCLWLQHTSFHWIIRSKDACTVTPLSTGDCIPVTFTFLYFFYPPSGVGRVVFYQNTPQPSHKMSLALVFSRCFVDNSNSLVFSELFCCSRFWSVTSKQCICKLQLSKNFAACVLTNTKKLIYSIFHPFWTIEELLNFVTSQWLIDL